MKRAMVNLLLVLFLLCYGVRDIHGSALPDNSTDMLSLQDFKNSITYDPSETLNSWKSSIDHCLWKGITCSRKHSGRVVALNLTGLGFVGSISSSVGNLTFLEAMDLSANSFSGQLPPFNRLHKLRFLNLSNNILLHGIIPDALTNCSNMRVMDLSKNSLEGEIPRKVDSLSKLAVLRLSYNNLSGIIPSSLSNITQINRIRFSYNQLTGTIPDELGNLPNMSQLSLGENMLSGEIPPSLFNMSSLQILGLEINMLGKTLPPKMGDALPNLWFLGLSQNMFEGHIPDSLGNASMLQILELSSNNFSGQIPSTFGKLSELQILNLQANKLEATDSQSWEFLFNCSSLQAISLRENQLHGSIPDSVGNLSTDLQQIFLDGNQLSGVVPASIGNLRGLYTLGLGGNHLSGTIEWIGKLTKLQGLLIGMNNFTGSIPSSIGNLANLNQLYLENNQFEGVVPPSLGNLSQLSYLNLSYNKLQGNISQVVNLKQLINLSLSSNQLIGEIPPTLSQCQNLVILQMDRNFLMGDIPISLGNLLSLSLLDLSHNKLSGNIPAALSDLHMLKKLDLSYNHLQGEVPRNGVFENNTAVSLEDNWGLCGGAMDLHMPLCPVVSRRSDTEYYLVRALIPIFGFTSLAMLTYIIIFGKKTSQRTYSFLLSFGKKFPRVSYKDLAQATGNFSESNLVGRGRYGSVYRGKLTQAKIQVAIKVFDLDMKCAEKSFVTECEVLRSIRHQNLLPILTACSTIENNGDAFKALIYEFMPNGNLDTWLHNKFAGGSSKCLSLAQRVSIAIGIADALAYLHHDCERQIVHCDLKPTNILLDYDMNVYLGDFGVASLLGHSSSNTSIGLKGTIGYIAPEYAQSGQASIRGDVFSFGVVLLEMLIGKRPTDPMFVNELNIVNFVERNYPDQILHIIDARLHGECNGQANIKTENGIYGCLLSLMQVAISCTRLIPRERMNMREVATKLHAIRTSYAEATKREQVMLH